MKNYINSAVLATSLLLIGTFLFNNFAGAQNSSLEIQTSTISISDGLASPDVLDVMQDSYGLLWLATSNGLQKYDGIHFETFKNIPNDPNSLMNNETWSLVEDDKRNIWIATASGVSRLDRKSKTFTNYSIADLLKTSDANGLVLHLFKDSKGILWGTSVNAGLIFYDRENDRWKMVKTSMSQSVSAGVGREFVISFTEDIYGGMWTGLIDKGLFYKSKSDSVFRHVDIASEKIDFSKNINTITALYADSANVLWLTTRMGVYKYYPNTGTLKTIVTYDYNALDRRNNMNNIHPDHEGNVWITNNFRGVLKFDGISDRYQNVVFSNSLFMSDLGWDAVLTDFTIDKSGIFWFGSWKGLIKYDPDKMPFSHYEHDANNSGSLSNNAIFGLSVSEINPEILYVGTRSSFLNIFNRKTKTFSQVKFKVEDDTYGGSVRSIAEGDDGSLWLGTWGDGLIQLDQQYQEIARYKYDATNNLSISDNKVRVIKKDERGNFWVGTTNGLNYFQPSTGIFRRIPTKMTKTYTQEIVKQVERLQDTEFAVAKIVNVIDYQDLFETFEVEEAGEYLVFAVGEGLDGTMADFGWIENAQNDTVWNFLDFDKTFFAGGDSKNRLSIESIELEPGKYTLRYFSDDSHSFNKWNAEPPNQTSSYGIFVAKSNDPGLVQSLNELNENVNKANTISGVSINAIDVHKDYVWIATAANGLNKIDLSDNTVQSYLHDEADQNSLSTNALKDVLEDRNGIVWIPSDAGVNKFDPETGQFTHYTEADGLPTNYTESILEGDNGVMWISTNSGLSQMVTSTSMDKVTFINFNAQDGLGGDTYIGQVAARTADGTFYFGGDHGLNAISSISANKTPPDLIFSDLLISNKSIFEMGDDSPLQSSLNESDRIELAYQDNNLSFEFAALHYANPEKNQYAHYLKGYDDDWVYDNRNYASYTNLDPGHYEFMIRASNSYGVWSDDTKTIQLKINPPWWKTWWAYLIYGLLFALGLIGFDRFMRRRLLRIQRERMRERELKQAKEIEKAYSELKATQSQLVQSEKMASLGELTAGIAHEIQNPLNFVNNFSEVSSELLEELKEEIKKGNQEEIKEIIDDVNQNLNKILHHGKRADAIVKNMLLHSRGNGGEKELTDINALADEYLRLSFHGLRAKDKSFNADFKLNSDESLPKVKVVPQDIGRVLLNLINNAFYACAERSRSPVNETVQQSENGYNPIVTVTTTKLKKGVEIRVTDNGNGIPESIKEKIFQPFFTSKPSGQGTGLGLSLSYDIVKAHGGKLSVQSEEGEGTTFTILL